MLRLCAICVAAERSLSIWGEDACVDIHSARKAPKLVARPDIPEPDGSVSTAGEHVEAVRGDGYFKDTSAVSFETLQFLPGLRVPQNYVIVPDEEQEATIERRGYCDEIIYT